MAQLRLCLHCNRHYQPPGIRNRCPDCGRKYDRQLSKQKRARRTRNSAAWQKAREAAKRRDGNRCAACGSTENLEVHHIRSLAEGGDEFALSNLRTLCRDCHARTAGVGARRKSAHHTPSAVIRETNSEAAWLSQTAENEGPLVG
jgi:5-methylcytosine-specific restriction endonuclease McrA